MKNFLQFSQKAQLYNSKITIATTVRSIFLELFLKIGAQLYNSKIAIATTARGIFLELFLKIGAPQKLTKRSLSVAQIATLLKKTLSKLLSKYSAKLKIVFFLCILNRGKTIFKEHLLGKK